MEAADRMDKLGEYRYEVKNDVFIFEFRFNDN